MLKRVVIVTSLFGATCAAPGFGAWGQFIRSFPVGLTSAYGLAVMPDGYLFVSGISRWRCYTTGGSFVKSLTGSTFNDGSGRCHLPGYFVVARSGRGVWRYRYNGGGNVGSGASLGLPATGRGISWDGTYYYVTIGSFGTPIGIYTSTGSQVGTIPGSGFTDLYGHATRAPGNDSILIARMATPRIHEVSISTGVSARSFSLVATPAGVDMDDLGYIYVVRQSGSVYVYDSGYGPNAVDPASLGCVKALFR